MDCTNLPRQVDTINWRKKNSPDLTPKFRRLPINDILKLSAIECNRHPRSGLTVEETQEQFKCPKRPKCPKCPKSQCAIECNNVVGSDPEEEVDAGGAAATGLVPQTHELPRGRALLLSCRSGRSPSDILLRWDRRREGGAGALRVGKVRVSERGLLLAESGIQI